MARLSHDLADARIAFRNQVSIELDRIARRVKQTGEDYITERYNEITARGGVWNYKEIAAEAFLYSQQVNNGIEAGEADVPDAA